MRIDRRRPPRSASAIPTNASSAPSRVTASALLHVVSEAWNACEIGPPSWPTSALANETTATAAAALARWVDCSSVNVAVGSPMTGFGGDAGAAPSSSARSRASA